MTDPLRDPRFPDRPQHPDFWRLSEILTQSDGQADEGGQSIEEILAPFIDVPSLTYMAEQRSALAAQRTQGPVTLGMMLMGIWIDGFLAGVKFEQRGGHQEA